VFLTVERSRIVRDIDDLTPLRLKSEWKLSEMVEGVSDSALVLWFYVEQQKTSATSTEEFASDRTCFSGPLVMIINGIGAYGINQAALETPSLVEYLSKAIQGPPLFENLQEICTKVFHPGEHFHFPVGRGLLLLEYVARSTSGPCVEHKEIVLKSLLGGVRADHWIHEDRFVRIEPRKKEKPLRYCVWVNAI